MTPAAGEPREGHLSPHPCLPPFPCGAVWRGSERPPPPSTACPSPPGLADGAGSTAGAGGEGLSEIPRSPGRGSSCYFAFHVLSYSPGNRRGCRVPGGARAAGRARREAAPREAAVTQAWRPGSGGPGHRGGRGRGPARRGRHVAEAGRAAGPRNGPQGGRLPPSALPCPSHGPCSGSRSRSRSGASRCRGRARARGRLDAWWLVQPVRAHTAGTARCRAGPGRAVCAPVCVECGRYTGELNTEVPR